MQTIAKRNKVIYWMATGLLSAFMIMNAVMYVIQNDLVSEMFVSLGYPTYLIYPLGTAKILGIIAILTRRSKLLKEWAYGGFFFNFLLALTAHLIVGDGGFVPTLVAIILLLVSRVYDGKVFGSDASTLEPTSTFEAIPQAAR